MQGVKGPVVASTLCSLDAEGVAGVLLEDRADSTPNRVVLPGKLQIVKGLLVLQPLHTHRKLELLGDPKNGARKAVRSQTILRHAGVELRLQFRGLRLSVDAKR